MDADDAAKTFALSLGLRDAIRKRQWRRGYEIADKLDRHMAMIAERERVARILQELPA